MSIVRTPQSAPLNTFIRSDSANANALFTFLLPSPSEQIRRFQALAQWSAPDSFNGKEVWKGYLSEIRNQGSCGGCYAFASTSALADAFNLRSSGETHINLSAARIITCDLLGQWSVFIDRMPEMRQTFIDHVYRAYGCDGNTLMESWAFLYTYGTNRESCFPDSILGNSTCADISSAQFDQCIDGSPAVFYRAQHIYAVAGIPSDGGNEYEIRKIIYKFGPVSSAMAIYSDFYTFDTSTIYIRSPNADRLFGHAIVIDGWGEENGVKYWWVRNSWGKKWGIGGYFKILRGQNHCDIESNVITGIPDSIAVISTFFTGGYFQETDLDPIGRRSVLTPYAIYGGIDLDTGISRRLQSFAKYADWPKKHVVHTPADTFFAGQLPPYGSTAALQQTKGNLMTILFASILGILLFVVLYLLIQPHKQKDNQ